ncbi:Periplasmic nitrate reductase component NapE, partial [Pseudomonas sp. FG-3G]
CRWLKNANLNAARKPGCSSSLSCSSFRCCRSPSSAATVSSSGFSRCCMALLALPT